VALGVFLGFFMKDINSVLQWIVSALYGGYIVANVLKWHWWRFNASGFFMGDALRDLMAAMSVFDAR
jgi:SSS family solute:Na+ symporter